MSEIAIEAGTWRAARLEFAARPELLRPALDFLLSCASALYPGTQRCERLERALVPVLELVLENNRGANEPISLDAGDCGGRFTVVIVHRGVPIFDAAEASTLNAHYYPRLLEASKQAELLKVENAWRQGQMIRLELSMGGSAPKAKVRTSLRIPDDETLTIRRLAPGEEEALSRLFYLVYGYEYVNEAVYRPERLKEMIASGELISVVAVRPNGRIVGHVGLVQKSRKPPVFEAAMGAVDPAVKSRGLFGKLFHETMQLAERTPMQYCLFDFVTNHDLSQRHVNRYGTRELAVLVGCQTRETQARLERLGLGQDPEGMDRYSLLVSIIPRVERPFGRELLLPERIGENFGFLLGPLGSSWSPAPRFQALGPGGRYSTRCHSAQQAAHFDLEEPGLGAAQDIVEEWRGLLRNGFQYAAVDAPLDRPGSGALYEMLSASGFFAAGFVPYRFTDRLGFRFQAVGPSKVAFDKIKVASEAGRRLLDIVRADYEASCLI